MTTEGSASADGGGLPSPPAHVIDRRCEKMTQRGKVCGRNLRADATCPGGYLHAEAPRYPRLWAPVSTLSLGVVVLFVFVIGGFSFVTPFLNRGSPTTGTPLQGGSTISLTGGTKYGIYDFSPCQPGLALSIAGPSPSTATLAITWISNGATYNETLIKEPSNTIQECGYTVPQKSGVYAVSNSPGSDLGLVPDSELVGADWYFAIFWVGVALTVIGALWLLWVLRRRNSARDPKERRDLSHDTIAKAAQQTASWLDQQQ